MTPNEVLALAEEITAEDIARRANMVALAAILFAAGWERIVLESYEGTCGQTFRIRANKSETTTFGAFLFVEDKRVYGGDAVLRKTYFDGSKDGRREVFATTPALLLSWARATFGGAQ